MLVVSSSWYYVIYVPCMDDYFERSTEVKENLSREKETKIQDSSIWYAA